MIEPEGKPIEADTVSGNIVLVSDAAERKLGNMWAGFEHIYGDLDYGLRAKAAGIPVMLASRVGGTCAANPIAGSSLDRSMGKWARLRRRWVESGKVHARDWRRFMDLHGKSDPVSRIAYRAAPYINILLDR
jgi:GT2 family glycosyltransferase